MTTVSKKLYHGKRGNVYSNAKLARVRYRMKDYKYTIWSVTKQAIVENNGRQASLSYIVSGKKKGWIYSKYLSAGKAQTKLAARSARILSTGSSKKYVTAYKHFSAKGHPLTQRGDSPIDSKTLKRSGFTDKQFRVRMWGMTDYYQNAINHKWVTEKQAAKAERAAFKNLTEGFYAHH